LSVRWRCLSLARKFFKAASRKVRNRPAQRISQAQGVFLEQRGEEGLDRIFGVGGGVAVPAHEGIERIPVGATQLFPRRGRLGRTGLAGRQHHAPVCRGETRGAG
jgi:hypothetical protein